MSAPKSFAHINLEQSRKLAKELVKAHQAGDPRALDRIRWTHPRFRGQSAEEIQRAEFALADAQLVIARTHHFANWPKMLQYVETIERNHPDVSRFEHAADAIVSGDIDALRTMLDAHPALVHERSTRSHASTLLHYVSANGIEGYRQITPPNIVEITTLLLDRGAAVDAESEAYGGGSTTLGLVATSAHPRKRGVQVALIDLLLARGANIDGEDTLHTLVHDALSNGCPEASNALATRGANVSNLYAQAGVGNLERVRSLLAAANSQRRERALIVAAQMGHTEVVRYLLDMGINVNASDGMSPMHRATSNARFDVMQLLRDRGADLEQRNEYGGAVLDSTLWFAHHASSGEFTLLDYVRVIEWLVAHGSRTDRYPELQDEIAGVYQRAAR